jgi:hypothetical protein
LMRLVRVAMPASMTSGEEMAKSLR